MDVGYQIFRIGKKIYKKLRAQALIFYSVLQLHLGCGLAKRVLWYMLHAVAQIFS
jgi:hypothetical protein